jgi:7-cyano-7-deazaguanine reductase
MSRWLTKAHENQTGCHCEGTKSPKQSPNAAGSEIASHPSDARNDDMERDFRVKYGKEEIEKAELEKWENPYQDRDYVIDISFPEFSCLCPRSGYPDYATIKINYVPDKYIVELRSLKLYLNKYRDQHISHESATNKIYDDLRSLLEPRKIEVVGDWNPRGNVKTVIRVSGE